METFLKVGFCVCRRMLISQFYLALESQLKLIKPTSSFLSFGKSLSRPKLFSLDFPCRSAAVCFEIAIFPDTQRFTKIHRASNMRNSKSRNFSSPQCWLRKSYFSRFFFRDSSQCSYIYRCFCSSHCK